MVKRRIIFAIVGLVYGLALTFWGMMISGGGHFNLPIILFISPGWAGLLFWPLWGFLSVRCSSLRSKAIFLLTMVAHFGGIIFYLYEAGSRDLSSFRIGMSASPTFILFPASAVVLYLVGQIYLWVRFLRDSFRRSDHLSEA